MYGDLRAFVLSGQFPRSRDLADIGGRPSPLLSFPSFRRGQCPGQRNSLLFLTSSELTRIPACLAPDRSLGRVSTHFRTPPTHSPKTQTPYHGHHEPGSEPQGVGPRSDLGGLVLLPG